MKTAKTILALALATSMVTMPGCLAANTPETNTLGNTSKNNYSNYNTLINGDTSNPQGFENYNVTAETEREWLSLVKNYVNKNYPTFSSATPIYAEFSLKDNTQQYYVCYKVEDNHSYGVLYYPKDEKLLTNFSYYFANNTITELANSTANELKISYTKAPVFNYEVFTHGVSNTSENTVKKEINENYFDSLVEQTQSTPIEMTLDKKDASNAELAQRLKENFSSVGITVKIVKTQS